MTQFSSRNQALAQSLTDILGERIASMTEYRGQLTIEVARDHWLDAAFLLRDEPELAFEQLIDLCGIDYLGYGDDEWETAEATSEGYSRAADALGPGRFSWEERPEAGEIQNRFAAVVQLLSIRHNRRLRLRCFAPDNELPVLPSLIEVWNSVNWYEREAFDLFGIVFEGHPDLRRIMTDYGFIGHPFRKDFPLIGNVTVRYDEDKGRVVYEPVEIEPRVTVARVVRRDSRYIDQKLEGTGS
ncbi:NADH-quinone oxidoreductase subunit C [Wenzhouxiangella sp. XN201]|uniref:NADH-quinone oxidoreductase subunit C n=1 Tax=Wenzhouxiangella sp. XN201 TaxID=2710755 RepID=UPI0013C5FC29|nr:NADH-quinone oxidoreductase subunit C [Wenzhouxiangella sp. XN201]NEZ02940.1 NADH-quinone oxidoreductase subunit C [Wenzhouxiangella sp. XN201]